MPALCQLAVFSFATAVPEGTGGSHWLCQPLFKPPGQCRPGVLGSSEWSSAMLRDPLGQSLWGDRPFVPVKSCSKSSLLGQRCHQQVPPVGARAGVGGVTSDVCPCSFITTDADLHRWMGPGMECVPSQTKRLWNRSASWEEGKQGELTPSCPHPSHPGHREVGHCQLHTSAGSAEQPTTASEQLQPPARIGILRGMGTESSTRSVSLCWGLGGFLPAGCSPRCQDEGTRCFLHPLLARCSGLCQDCIWMGPKVCFEPCTGEQGSLAPGLVEKGCFAPHAE